MAMCAKLLLGLAMPLSVQGASQSWSVAVTLKATDAKCVADNQAQLLSGLVALDSTTKVTGLEMKETCPATPAPTPAPTAAPTAATTAAATAATTVAPVTNATTVAPTVAPTPAPAAPTVAPTAAPTPTAPTAAPVPATNATTVAPTAAPTPAPAAPTVATTAAPTPAPTPFSCDAATKKAGCVVATVTFDETIEDDATGDTIADVEMKVAAMAEAAIEGSFPGVVVTDVTAIATKVAATSGAPAAGLCVTALMSILLLTDLSRQ